MDVAFVAAIARPGHRLTADAIDVIESPQPAGLHFEPAAHTTWATAAGDVRVACWFEKHGPGEAAQAWRGHADRVALLAGYARRRGHPLEDRAELLRAIHPFPGDADAARGGSYALPEAMNGVYAGLSFEASGSGVIYADPFGWRYLYVAETPDVFVVATRPALAAQVLAGGGARPARDPLSAAWLGWARFLVTDTTGYEGVRVLSPGDWVRVRAGAIDVVGGRAPWQQSASRADRPIVELLAEIRDELAEQMVGIVSAPNREVVVDLTGGRDSRILLAVALAGGFADRLRFRTIGFAGLADVDIATELAALYGLDHEVVFPAHAPPSPWRERVTAFVEATSGMASIWDERRRGDEPPLVRVSGFPGETVRGYWRKDRPPETRAALVAFLERKASRAHLIRPEVATHLLEVMADEAWDPDGTGLAMDPYDRLDVYANRNPWRQRLGPRADLETEERHFPLAATDVLRRAYAVPGRYRWVELIPFFLTHEGDPALAAHRYTDKGWDTSLLGPVLAELGLDATLPEPHPAPTGPAVGPPSPTGKAEPLMAGFMRTADDERFDEMADILADASNPVWEVADRPATLGALARVRELTKLEQQELYGVVTGALWLGGG